MRKLLVLVGLATAVSPAAASEPRTSRVGVNNDPSQVVCRTEREIGSRLRVNRVCRTRAQWAEYRREARQAVTRAQEQIGTRDDQ